MVCRALADAGQAHRRSDRQRTQLGFRGSADDFKRLVDRLGFDCGLPRALPRAACKRRTPTPVDRPPYYWRL